MIENYFQKSLYQVNFSVIFNKKEGDCYRRYWGQHESNSKTSWCNTRTPGRT